MKNKYTQWLTASIHNHTLLSALWRKLLALFPIRIIKNPGILDLQNRDRIFKKLRRNYSYIIDNASEQFGADHKFSKTIWWCWLQGYESAPELTKTCYESLKRNMPGYTVNIVSYDNLSDYVTLPVYVTDKHTRGIIGAAHFSDIIRLELLIRYGGIWIDSTVLCTDSEMCPLFETAPLFIYQNLMMSGNNSVGSSWLISAETNSPVLILTRDLLLEYWKRRNIQEHYFLFHLFLSIAMRKYPIIWRQLPPYNNVSPHMLFRAMGTRYSNEQYTMFKKFSSFHKLNYRVNDFHDGTFYDILIRRRLF